MPQNSIDDAIETLESTNLHRKMSREQEAARIAAAQQRLLWLRLTLGGQLCEPGAKRFGPPIAVAFEGWDAAGKGGAIKRLVAPMDPRFVRVAQFAAPTSDEKRHQFLWRFVPKMPGKGGMAVFDRTWYGRVLVERIEGYCEEEEWHRAYEEIRDFERAYTADGMILLKFWLHISPEEQLRRFEDRARDPLRQWKLTAEDWRNRDKRDAYTEAVRDIILETSTPNAPWTVIPGDNKRYARVAVLETVVETIEEALRRQGFEVPPQPAAAH